MFWQRRQESCSFHKNCVQKDPRKEKYSNFCDVTTGSAVQPTNTSQYPVSPAKRLAKKLKNEQPPSMGGKTVISWQIRMLFRVMTIIYWLSIQ